ncbi:MAG: energy-coupling factor transporter ATPase [Lachnospiraceae bacterium]|nr:energy-coupling factor transporter ATPase [Lachnospiraceae bacterium]
MEEMLRSDKLEFAYAAEEEENAQPPAFALRGVDMTVRPGEFVVILGHNGSGKSTFARHINALLQPSAGTLWVEGMDTKQEDKIWLIRQKAGMIFQNPDNQMVASIVEEDVAFGPENLGMQPEKIRMNVKEALEAVGMLSHRKSVPTRLSGGQKQRIAIAGVLAMRPECIVLDEPTAMLDPKGRQEVMETLWKLNKEEKITVIHITHYMEEAVQADRVIVMDHGKIVLEGTPKEVFSQVEELKKYGLDVPPMTELAYRLRKDGLSLPQDILTTKEMVDALCQLK